MKWICALVIATAAFAPPGIAQTTEAEKIAIEQSHQALRKLKADVEAAMNRGDIDSVLKHAHKDVIFTSLNGGGGRGHAKIREYDEKMRKGPAKVVESVHVTFKPDDLSLIYGGDTAISWGSSVGKYKFVNGDEHEILSRWTSTLIREDGKWLIASFHISANMFDNTVLSAITKTLYWAICIAALIALAIGLLIGRLRKRQAPQ